MTRVAIIGAAGRMGRELCRAALETEGFELAGGTVEPGAPELGADLGELCGFGKAGVAATEDPPEDAGVLIEFTTPEATVEHLSYGKPHVIGTTGLSGEQQARGRGGGARRSHRARPEHERRGEPAARGGARALGEARGGLRRRGSRGAPPQQEGCALWHGALPGAGRRRGPGPDLDEVAVYGREGVAPRGEGEIGVHALRGGAVVGEHRLIFYSDGEEVEVVHRALSRRTFADGALRAARFAAAAEPGLYSMRDVLNARA